MVYITPVELRPNADQKGLLLGSLRVFHVAVICCHVLMAEGTGDGCRSRDCLHNACRITKLDSGKLYLGV